MDYIISAFSMLALDSIYLSTLGSSLFHPMIKNIQGEKMKLNVHGAIIVYILLILVFYKFIIVKNESPSQAFLLGFCIYGIYDFTNMALFSKYEWLPAIVDMVWGGVLFYIVTYVTYSLTGKKV